MLPEARRDGTLAVAMLVQSFFEELLCENTSLWKAAHPFLDCDVDKFDGGGLVGEVIHLYELLREVLDFHAHEFWSCHWHHEVKILAVNGVIARVFGEDHTVEVELDGDHVNLGHATVPRVVYSGATDGEACAIWVVLIGAKMYTDATICYILVAVGGDLVA